MTIVCGLDFGTSNTTLGATNHADCRLIALENAQPAVRSAIFCDTEMKEWVFGQEGVNRYLDACPGRLMMSLKSVLGTSLMDDKTFIFNEYISYKDILGRFIKHVKSIAELELNQPLTQVVMGRPVHFHDHDFEKDALAEETLKQIAKSVGFTDVLFQYEPIAAAMTYETTVQHEQLALIVDMGGGTSDFTIIRVYPGKKSADRASDVLANCGIHIAGTDFDRQLNINTVMPELGMESLMRGSSADIPVPSMLYHDLTTWHTINLNYTPTHIAHVRSIQAMAYNKLGFQRLLHVLQRRSGHHIMQEIEIAKQRLSDIAETELDLSFISPEPILSLSRSTLNDIIEDDVDKIIATIRSAVSMAGIDFSAINALFYTGGSTKIPMIRERVNALFPNATIVQGDAFGSVGLGLTIDAKRRFLME